MEIQYMCIALANIVAWKEEEGINTHCTGTCAVHKHVDIDTTNKTSEWVGWSYPTPSGLNSHMKKATRLIKCCIYKQTPHIYMYVHVHIYTQCQSMYTGHTIPTPNFPTMPLVLWRVYLSGDTEVFMALKYVQLRCHFQVEEWPLFWERQREKREGWGRKGRG